MSKKSKKVDKSTRHLIDSLGDMTVKKDGKFVFKGKGKKYKKIKKSCMHWIIRKGKELPTVYREKGDDKWTCTLCGERFKVAPYSESEYETMINNTMEIANQMQFWSIGLGGDKEDTQMLLELKSDLRKLRKTVRQIRKRIDQKGNMDNKTDKDVISQFNPYNGYGYNA